MHAARQPRAAAAAHLHRRLHARLALPHRRPQLGECAVQRGRQRCLPRLQQLHQRGALARQLSGLAAAAAATSLLLQHAARPAAGDQARGWLACACGTQQQRPTRCAATLLQAWRKPRATTHAQQRTHSLHGLVHSTACDCSPAKEAEEHQLSLLQAGVAGNDFQHLGTHL